MNIAVFQHEPTEPLGYLEQVFSEHNVPFEYIRLYETGEVPRINATHLVFMGGPMSVNDEREYPYLKQEKELIRKSPKNRAESTRDLPWRPAHCLRFRCTGVPLRYGNRLARARTLDGSTGSFARFPEKFHVFQLHGDTFAIPYGGKLLCTGEQVRNQGFSVYNCLGLQFHLEMTGEIIRQWSRVLRKYDRERIARDTPRYLAESNRLCRSVAEDFIKK